MRRAGRWGVVLAALSLLPAILPAQGAAGWQDPRTAVRAPTAAVLPWSLRMARSVVRRDPVVSAKWDYTAGLVLLAIERLGEARRDTALLGYVRDNMNRFVAPDGTIHTFDPGEHSLDQINQGRLLFPLLARTRDRRYAIAAATLRAALRDQPRTADGGFWHKEIYPQQMWLDGLYMAEPFYAEWADVFHEPAAFDDVTHQLLLVARHTRDARTGLLYHAWDASHRQPWANPETGLSRNFWGRADGWYAMALVDVLDYLPRSHADRPALIQTLRALAAAISAVQDPVTGLWYQVLDQPSRTGNYLEASASSMFVYALAKGVHQGYLDHRYLAVAQRGFDGLLRNLVTVDATGLVTLHGICKVAGLGGNPPRDGSFRYYVHEPVVSNDYKGVGPFIMAAQELKR